MCQQEASSTFPGPVSGTSVLISSFKGHLVTRCYFPFLHLQTVFPRSVLPLCSVLMEENRNNLFAVFTLPLPNLVYAISPRIFLSLKTSLINLIFSSQPLGTSPLPASTLRGILISRPLLCPCLLADTGGRDPQEIPRWGDIWTLETEPCGSQTKSRTLDRETVSSGALSPPHSPASAAGQRQSGHSFKMESGGKVQTRQVTLHNYKESQCPQMVVERVDLLSPRTSGCWLSGKKACPDDSVRGTWDGMIISEGREYPE